MKHFLLILGFLGVGVVGWGQVTYAWRNDQNGSFNWAETSPIFWWRGNAEVPAGNEILTFDGNNGLISTNNLVNTSRYRIFFNNTNSPASRTLNGVTTNTFFDFSSNHPQIVNNSGVQHTINFPFNNGNNTVTNRLELLANSGNLTFGGAIGAVGGNRTLVAGGAAQITFNSVISGTSPNTLTFLREGGGVARLNAIHTYTGQTQIDNGEVWIESGGGIATGSGIFVGNGAQLTNTAKLWLSNATGGTTFSNNFTINQGNATTREIGGLNTSGTHTFSGTITNNSTNGLLVTALNSGGTLNVSGDVNQSIGTGNPLTFNAVGNINFTGRLLSSTGGTLTKNGTGVLTASGLSNFTGITTISSGTFRLGAAGTASPSESPLGTSLNRTEVNSGAVLDLNGFSLAPSEDLTINGTGISSGGALTNSSATAANWIGVLTLGSAASIVANNGAINLTNTGSAGGSGAFILTLAGSTGGSLAHNMLATGSVGAITKEGSGTWVLSGASTYTGATTINAGILRISGGANRLPTATAVSIASGAIFDLNGQNQQIGSLASTTTGGNVTLGSGTLTIGGTATTTFSGAISGSGGLTKQGAGLQTLSGTNTYTGATTINAGDLVYNSAGALPNASNVELAGGRMVLANTIPAATYTPGTLTLSGTTNSEIVLGASANAVTITFANSSAASWTTGRRITIRNWSPTGNKNIFFSGQGLLSDQLAVIDFDGYGLGAKFDGATNRIIPRFIYVTQATGSGNFSAQTSWLNNDNPFGTSCASNPATIVIQSGFTLTQDIAYDLTRIENSGTYLSNAVTITLCAGGSFVNNGIVDFTTAGGGTLVCAGAAIFSGTASSANFALNNLTLNGVTTLTTAPTIRGNLELNAGSSVSPAPVYASTSTLVYNQGGTIAMGPEWAVGNASSIGAGLPQNVTIQNNTTVNLSAANRGCAGNLLINGGSSLTLSTTSGADLYVAGNFTNNGTFNHNNRALFMVGGSLQSLNGTLNATGAANCLPFLLINKSGGTTVTLNTPVNVTNTLTLTNGTITLGGNNLQITSGNDVAGAPFSTTKMVIADGSGQLLFITATNKTYLFPIGDNTSGLDYSPISISVIAGAASGNTIGMRVVDAAVPATPLNIPTAPTDYLTRYWVPSNSGFLTISWTGSATFAPVDVINTEANIRFNIWHASTENAWMDYGIAPVSSTISFTTPVTSLAALGSGVFITGRSPAPKLFYRSINSGTWSTLSNWETSPVADFGSGIATPFVAPSSLNSNGINIRNGHTIAITADASLDQCVIANGGILEKGNGNLGVNEGLGDDLEILNGGVFRHASTSGLNAVLIPGSRVVVRTGGMIEVTSNFTGASFYATSPQVFYETNAVFNWNVNNPFATSDAIYFPNAGLSVVPVFRVSSPINLAVGSNNQTTINGLFEANGNLTWDNTGVKIFRNGIAGTATITQGSNCGQFRINGTTSVFGPNIGTLTLALRNEVTSGIALQSGVCTMSGNVVCNIGPVYIDNTATLNSGIYTLSGTSSFTLNAGATLSTANIGGINNSVSLSGTTTFSTSANFSFIGTQNQVTGTSMPTTVAVFTIANTGSTNNTVTLSNTGTTVSTLNLNSGVLACGAGQTLNIAAGGTIDIPASGGAGRQATGTNAGTINFIGTGNVIARQTGLPQLTNVVVNATSVSFSGGGSSNATINGTLELRAGANISNSPFYANSSTLVYNTGGDYNRQVEWGAASGPGYPHHVRVQGGTTLRANMAALTPASWTMGGNLELGTTGSSGSLNFDGGTKRMVVNGNVVIGSNTGTSLLTLGGFDVTTSNAGDLEIRGSFTRTDNGDINFGSGPGRAVFFTGSSAATISAPAPQVFPFLIVDKGGVASTTLTLDTSVNVAQKLTLSSGRIITTASKILSITNANPDAIDAGVDVGADTSLANNNGYVDGPMRRHTRAITAGGSQRYLFPVGKWDGTNHHYKRMFLRDLSGTGTAQFEVEYMRAQPPGSNDWLFQNILMAIASNEYWNVNRASGTLQGRLVLPYLSGITWFEEGKLSFPAQPNSNVAVVRGSGSEPNLNWNFTAPDSLAFNQFTPPVQAIHHTVSGDVMSRLVTEFSPFTLGWGANTILPLRLLSFSGVLHGVDAHLNWTLADVDDLRHFEVEHSTNGQDFGQIATVFPNGTTTFTHHHRQLSKGVHYYRLLMVEKDGQTSYSQVVVLMVDAQKTIITGLIQNPVVGGQARIGVFSERNQQAEVVVMDLSGKMLLRQKVPLLTGYNEPVVSVLPLPAAMYKIKVQTQDGVSKTMSMVK